MVRNPKQCPLCGSDNLINEKSVLHQNKEHRTEYIKLRCGECGKTLRPDRYCCRCRNYFEDVVNEHGHCPLCAEKVKNQHNALVGYKHRLRGDKTLTEEQITDMVEEKRKEQDGGV